MCENISGWKAVSCTSKGGLIAKTRRVHVAVWNGCQEDKTVERIYTLQGG